MTHFNTRESKAFEKNWGKKVLRSGFTQIPNDLIRNLYKLNLTPYDSAVLIYIISVDRGYASAKTIAKAQGISEGRVRKSFKSLRKLGYVKFIQEDGQPFKFEIHGLIKAVREIAHNKERSTRNERRGVDLLEHTPQRSKHTNEELNTKDFKEGDGWSKFQKEKERLGI